jgi:N-acetyl-gamma-glutamyl-phosphate reductase
MLEVPALVAAACARAEYDDFGEPFVRVLPRGTWPEPRNVRGTNLVEIGWQVDDDGESAVVMTAIDNLGKGAAGQAVQNFNCMMGLDERTGLVALPALP